MRDISGKVNVIIIPTGENVVRDFERLGVAIAYNRDFCDSEARYLVSGIGPDLNKFLYEREKRVDLGFLEGLEVHFGLWDFMEAHSKKTGQIFGIDDASKRTIDNLRNCFPKEQIGNYGIVSFPGHLTRIRSYELALRKIGEMSDDLHIKYIPTNNFDKQTLAEHVHGLKGLVDRVALGLGKDIC